MTTEPRYLYRFDNLDSLRKQRLSDPALRGRRSLGNEPSFPHYQLRDELEKITDGYAVYRLSFWKTWEDLLVNLFSYKKGWAVQRIPENHPALSNFKRDHDEYLESSAWLYWNAFPINQDAPDWSPIGIPHTDIEVLHPNGSWMPMEQIPCLSEVAPEDWRTYYLNGYASDPKPIHVATRTSTELSIPINRVMIRQHAAPWISAISLPPELFSIITNEFAISLESACWIYAVEHNDRTLAEEIYPRIYQPREPGLKGFINRIRKKYPQKKIVISDNMNFLPSSKVEILYEAFGISEYLRRGDRWSNKHLLLTLERIQEIRIKREMEFQAEHAKGKQMGDIHNEQLTGSAS